MQRGASCKSSVRVPWACWFGAQETVLVVCADFGSNNVWAQNATLLSCSFLGHG